MITPEQQQARRGKLERLRAGAKLRTLEICSGAGGLSLGLATAGFELTAHVEVDSEAAQSYALNFGGDRAADDPWSVPRNMEHCSADDLVRELCLKTTTRSEEHTSELQSLMRISY